MKICSSFYQKYYADNKKRSLIIGINPGRFGAGVTGIPFTDPIRLKRIVVSVMPGPLNRNCHRFLFMK
jgi:hypothetical protein